MDQNNNEKLENVDEEFEDEIITLIDDKGEEKDFYVDAEFEFNDNLYIVLEPVEEEEANEEEPEFLIFKEIERGVNEYALENLDSEEEYVAVYQEFIRLLEEDEGDCCCCSHEHSEDCDCSECVECKDDCEGCEKL